MRVLGIDPGLALTGYGCVRFGAENAVDVGALMEAGVVRLPPGRSVSARLAELASDLEELLGRLKPDVVCVEAIYAHYAHPRTAITMAHARGVILLCLERAGVELVEVPSTQAKKSLTGNGHASKAQMQEAVRMVLGLRAAPEPADVADAIAIALAGARMRAEERIVEEAGR